MKRIGMFQAGSRGQALVEAALFFPMILILVAGLVEVSQLVITQNRVTDASRAAARFGAQGGEDVGIINTAMNTVTQTLKTDDNVWDIWIIRAIINEDGTDYTDWSFTHAYGYSNTIKSAELQESNIKQFVLDELHTDHTGTSSNAIAGDLELVGVYAIHDVESILGLEAIPALEGISSITELNVVRVEGKQIEQTIGCSAFPIAVHTGVRSVTPPGEGANPYPDASEFDYPSSPPAYDDFYNHHPNVSLEQAKEGDIFFIHQGFGSGNFGWLLWNVGRPGSANTLADSLTWPGDSVDYTNHGDHSIQPAADAYPYIVRGYVEPGDATDTSLQVGDWIAANTGAINASEVRGQIESLVSGNGTVRVIVWDDATDQGSNGKYRASGFAIFRLIGYHLSQGQGGSWILAEFIRLDESCGQLQN